ncbi:single-stranded-DNA-specific exonuclease RecJ [Trichothermofontia sp.]
MSPPPPQWQLVTPVEPPTWFVQAVRTHIPIASEGSRGAASGHFVAQIFWQRGIQTASALAQFVDPHAYLPTNPAEFGLEMSRAVARLQQAIVQQETVAIWGDFDADGVTATAVLWEGLRPLFPQPGQLHYYIPNRLHESHGLSRSGLDALADHGCRLIITCDTGSTNRAEITYAQTLGIEIIVTDHHTLPAERPPVVAIVNPRNLPTDHPLAHLSGVAVAYKLLEALYQALPDRDAQPLTDVLDLVAIGLIADLVALKGDCRYLAQRGIAALQTHSQDPSRRPGVHRLLKLCCRTGDRPTDIAFGLGPRINAVSRIQGDAHFCVELLTSRDRDRGYALAEQAELLNTRRKALQKDILEQAIVKLADLDLSTTHVIVLAEVDWPVGILGLVASQVAQQTGRPTILFSLAPTPPASKSSDDEIQGSEIQNSKFKIQNSAPLARGSARSVNQIDLYQLVKGQDHLLTSFGGHPFAAGLALPVENLPLFTEAINQQLRQQMITPPKPRLMVDLTVTVADLGKSLFQELKLLEPCGMGNPVPRLLLKNVWFEQTRNAHIQDQTGQKLRYLKTEFLIRDATTTAGFPGVWWDHAVSDLPSDRCDVVGELDFNAKHKAYHFRLIDLRVVSAPETSAPMAALSGLNTAARHGMGGSDWLLDWRAGVPEPMPLTIAPLVVTTYPNHWGDLAPWLAQALATERPLAIAFPAPTAVPPSTLWTQLLGMAKYLARTQKTITLAAWAEALGIPLPVLSTGLGALITLGFQWEGVTEGGMETGTAIAGTAPAIVLQWSAEARQPEVVIRAAIDRFFTAFQENQFRQRYFYQAPWSTIQAMATQMLQGSLRPEPSRPDTPLGTAENLAPIGNF